MTNVTVTANALATYYTGLGSYVGLATGNPGTTASPLNEASGGSPAYARKSTSPWVVSGAVGLGASVTFNVPAGTYNYLIFCSGSSGNNMIDWAPIPSQVCSVQTTITLTPQAAAS